MSLRRIRKEAERPIAPFTKHAVSSNNPLARRQNISLAVLVQERRIMTPIESPGAEALVRAFWDEKLSPPQFSISTFSVFFVSSGRYDAY